MRFRVQTAGVLYGAAAVFFVLLLLVKPEEAYEGAAQGLLLWYKNVLPVQFPFCVAVRMLRDTGCLERMAVLLGPVVRKWFHLPGIASIALVGGWISGYPIGGQLALQLYKEDKLTEDEYRHLLVFCNTPGPLYVVTTVGFQLLGDVRRGYILLISQLAAAILCGVLFRPSIVDRKCSHRRTFIRRQSFGDLLRTAIDEAVGTVVMVGGFIVLFSVLLAWLPSGVITAGLEMTNGCAWLAQYMREMRIPAIAFLLGWGGICVLLQIAATVKDGPVLTWKFCIGRILMGVIAGVISGILSGFLIG